jgi:cell division protein ZapA
MRIHHRWEEYSWYATTLDPGDTRKGLVCSYQGSYSVAPSHPGCEGRAVNQQEGGMSAEPVDIHIFGRSLRVNCPPEQRDALNQAADDLNQRLQDLKERTRVTNTEQLVFIAALNISYELTQEKSKTRDYASSMEQRIRMLQQTIEQALLDQGRSAEKSGQNFE